MLNRGKLLAAPPGTWSRPPERAADGLPAALCSWKRSPNPARAPCDTSEPRGVCTALPAITRAWLSPSTGASSAALPPSLVSTFGWEKSSPGAPLQGEEGVRVETQCHSPPGGRGDGRHSPTAEGHEGSCIAFVPPRHQHQAEEGDSPFVVSHVTPGLAEIWVLLPCRAARCSQQGNI